MADKQAVSAKEREEGLLFGWAGEGEEEKGESEREC